ncbi:hypothetical protein ACHAO4_000117 [Trichoderma viride]
MASQQTPPMAERAAQDNLPEEMIAAGFQPYYQPYPGQQQTIAPPPLETSKRAEFVRLGFFGGALLLGIIGLGLSLSSLGGSDISVAIAALPASALATIWGLAEVITRAVRKFKKGIHPGAHVGVCLIIWMIASVTGGMLCTYVALYNGYYDNDDCSYTTSDGESNVSSYDCAPLDPAPKGKIVGSAVITCMLFAINFGLFIDACIQTHRRNTAAKRPIMVIAQPQNWPVASQGWQPMPQNGMSAESVQMQPPAAAAKEPVIREYYAPA